jgi:hypothetical protein
MWQLAIESIVAVMPESGGQVRRGLQEDMLAGVPRLGKDTLMPKDLSE